MRKAIRVKHKRNSAIILTTEIDGGASIRFSTFDGTDQVHAKHFHRLGANFTGIRLSKEGVEGLLVLLLDMHKSQFLKGMV